MNETPPLQGQIAFLDKNTDEQIIVDNFGLEEGNATNGVYVGKSGDLRVEVSVKRTGDEDVYHITWDTKKYELDTDENREAHDNLELNIPVNQELD